MTSLQTFAQTVTEARKVFDANRDMAAWLALNSFWKYGDAQELSTTVAIPRSLAIAATAARSCILKTRLDGDSR